MCLAPRLEQRLTLELRQEFNPYEWGADPFATEGEQAQISQGEILQNLKTLIEKGDFVDRDHFDLEINRAIFGHPLEAHIGNFGRTMQGLLTNYEGNAERTRQIISLIGSQADPEKKDIPGKIASAWQSTLTHPFFADEQISKRVLGLIQYLNEQKADTASGIDIVAEAAKVDKEDALVQQSVAKIEEYCKGDKRIITYAGPIAASLLKAIQTRGEVLNSVQARAIYQDIIEQIYMLDRDMRVQGVQSKIAREIINEGIDKVLKSDLPVPLQATLNVLQVDPATYSRIKELAQSPEFVRGREIKRSLYRGFASLEEIANGQEIIRHAATHATDIKGLANIASAVDLVHGDKDFAYPFNLTTQSEIVKNLRLQLVDRSVKRLGLDENQLEKYLSRIEKDEKFRSIGNIVTTLAGYSHYNNKLSLLKEITEAELDGKFSDWRYRHNLSDEQLEVLGENKDSWKENRKITRIVGASDALQEHITSLRKAVPNLQEMYADYYKAEKENGADEIQKRIEENEEKLRGKISSPERKELGYRTSLLREQASYLSLLKRLRDLNLDNYEEVLKLAEKLSNKRAQNLLYEHAKWVRDTLDQPAYREARRVQVVETDDLETILRMGEVPAPHCQNWKVDSTLNNSLLSFVADSNKKIYQIRDMSDTPISMSMVRLVDWIGAPTILVENVYGREWNNEYGIALLGSLADKAAVIAKETGKQTRIATNNYQLQEAFRTFGKKYNVEVYEETLRSSPAKSKSTHEYWDCGPGLVKSGASVSFNVIYVSFRGNKDE